MRTTIEWDVIERELRSVVNHCYAMAEFPMTQEPKAALAYIAAATEVRASMRRLLSYAQDVSTDARQGWQL